MTSSGQAKNGVATSPARRLGPEDAAIFETFVVPRYLSMFGDRMLAMLARGKDARVCHLQCRTGYPDRLLLEPLPNAEIYGTDNSPHAIDLARAKALAVGGGSFHYRVVDGFPLPFPTGAFSHAFTIHPLAAPAERTRLFEELARLLPARGQALVGMPLRGSFAEIADLLRECALKHELADLSNAVEAAVQLRPTEELLARELAEAGFEYVEASAEPRTLKFGSGRDFLEDPVTRLLFLPEFRVNLAMEDIEAPLAYVRDAIDKYWSAGTFELGVIVGVVSGRRKS